MLRKLGTSQRSLLRNCAFSMSTQPPKGYEAFGSFHTPSIKALFDGDIPPDLPHSSSFLPSLPSTRLELSTTHNKNNRSHFTMNLEQWTYLNHGAFGGTTRYASAVATAWRRVADQQPLRFHDRLLFPYLVQSIKALAQFLNIDNPQQLVLLPNATTGLHSVLSSIVHHIPDVTCVCFSTRYGAVGKILQDLGITVHEETLTYMDSLNDTILLSRLQQQLERLGSSQVVVLVDHITSNTGVLLPLERIITLCHQYHAIVVVDGAHGLLNLPLDLSQLQPDYYIGNCHKWLCAPRGSAFLYTHQVQDTNHIHPRVVSHGYFDGYQQAFMWLGLQDYSPWLTLPSCLLYWKQQGVETCRHYMHTLVQQAAEEMYTRWNMHFHLVETKKLAQNKRHAMRLIELPQITSGLLGLEVVNDVRVRPNTSTDAKVLQDILHYQYQIEVPIKCIEEKLYIRISAHVYNLLEEYIYLAQVIQHNRT